jgi:hypothetical protein
MSSKVFGADRNIGRLGLKELFCTSESFWKVGKRFPCFNRHVVIDVLHVGKPILRPSQSNTFHFHRRRPGTTYEVFNVNRIEREEKIMLV